MKQNRSECETRKREIVLSRDYDKNQFHLNFATRESKSEKSCREKILKLCLMKVSFVIILCLILLCDQLVDCKGGGGRGGDKKIAFKYFLNNFFVKSLNYL